MQALSPRRAEHYRGDAYYTNKQSIYDGHTRMPESAILIVNLGNGTVRRLSSMRGRRTMFDQLAEELLDLRVTEKGSPAVGSAYAAFPLCIAIILCCSCSKSTNE